MHLLIYEFVTGGGFLCSTGKNPPADSLLTEGLAMVNAVAEDLAAVPGAQVTVLRDARLTCALTTPLAAVNLQVVEIASAAEHWRKLGELAMQADYVLLVAPEIDGHLLNICRFVADRGARLMSPPATVVAWAADKHQTVVRLSATGIPCPTGSVVPGDLPIDFAFPAVIKPRHGAGSTGVRILPNELSLHSSDWFDGSYRVERWIPGHPASVAVLTGPSGHVLLPSCWQLLSDDGRCTYLGGRLIDDECYARRAHRLASKVAKHLADSVGYVGIDMILGAREDGAADVVVEVNPRLTTSYIGLRRATEQNLGHAMLSVAMGEHVDLSFHVDSPEFRCADATWGRTAGRTELQTGSPSRENVT